MRRYQALLMLCMVRNLPHVLQKLPLFNYALKPQGLASEASYLWKIKPPKDKGVVSYLFGSIHVPHSKVYPSLSDEVKEAFKVICNLYCSRT